MRTSALRITTVVAACLPILAPLAAHAQVARTGVIMGRVHDIDALALPQATVVLSSPDLIGGDKTVTAGVDGNFRFPALPPGIYSVTASLQGFDSQRQGDIRLASGTTLMVAFTLVIGASATITVLGAAPVVDIKSSGVANTTITEEFAQSLPSGRSAAGLIDFVPGVVSDDGTRCCSTNTNRSTGVTGRNSSAFGGTLQGTQFSFDGIIANSPETGGLLFDMDFDNVAEATFTGVGGAAEVGGYSGAIFNLITKSGSDEVHGAANFFYRGDEWNSQNSDDPEFRQETSNNRNWHVDLGGPLAPGRLWAYGSFRRSVRNEATELAGGFDGFRKNNQALLKLTGQITPGDKLSGHINWDDANNQQPADRFTAPEAATAFSERFVAYNLDYLRIFSEDTYLDVKFGVTDIASVDFPDSQSVPAAHFLLDQDLLTESPGFFFDGFRNRYQLNVALTHYAEDFLAGAHDFKVGFQGDWAQPRVNIGYTGECCGGAAYYVDYAAGEPAYRYEFQSLEIDPLGTTLSFFVQDSWTLNNGRVTINSGIRVNDWTGNAKARLGPITGVEASVSDLGDHYQPQIGIAPRIGFAFDLLGDGTTALKAHWGRYYPQLISANYAGFESFPSVTRQDSFWDPDAEAFVVDRTDFAPDGVPIDPDLKMTNFTELSVGIERQLTRDVSFEVNGVIRDTHAGSVPSPVEKEMA